VTASSERSPSSPRARLPRGQGELLRPRILDAAEALLVAGADEHAVSMRAVAEAVGVTPPALYRHFADKDDLLLEVCERRFAELDALLERAAAAADGGDPADPVDPADPLAALRLRAEAYVRFGLAHPEHYRILFLKGPGGVERRAAERAGAGRRTFEHLVAAVQAALDSGQLRPGDATVLAISLWSALHGLTALLITVPSFPWPPVETLVATTVEVSLRGMAAR
jgi:AcrR family transcriptional regulator